MPYRYVPSIPTDYGRQQGFGVTVEVTCDCGAVTAHNVSFPDTAREIALEQVAKCSCKPIFSERKFGR